MHSQTMRIGNKLGVILTPKKEYDAVIVGGGGHGLSYSLLFSKET